MTTSYYERLLGLPVEMVTPDYVQLLGLPPDEEDQHAEAEVTAALADRLDRLSSAPPADRAVVEHLRRELQRARATVLDAGGRARHLAEVKQRRLRDLAALTATQLGTGRIVPPAAEQALLELARGWGLSAAEARGALDTALAARGGSRGDGPPPSLPALHAARERLRRAMAELADERLREDAGAPPTEAPVARPRRRTTPPRPAPALEPIAGPAPKAAPVEADVRTGVRTDDVEGDDGDDDEGGAGHWSPGAATSTTSVTTPAPAAPAAPPVDASTPWPTIVRGEERARLERRSRRAQRTCLALAALAGAFVAGDLFAALAPVQAGWIDAATAPARARLLASPRLVELAGGAGAAAVLLSALLVWLAGREARRPYLAPLALLALPVTIAGLLPVGHERGLADERDAALAQRDAVAEQARALAAARDDAERRHLIAVADVTSRDAALAALRDEAAARARRVATLEGWVRRYAADRRAQKEVIAGLRAEVAGLEQEVAALTSATSGPPAPAAPAVDEAQSDAARSTETVAR